MSRSSWCLIRVFVIMIPQLALSPSVSQGADKPGVCPFSIKPECPAYPVQACSIDSNCPGTQKCCADGCSGTECRDALRDPSAGSGAGPTTSSPFFPTVSSVILSENISYYESVLRMWFRSNSTWTLCWRATRDGWAAKTFHSNCDYKNRTVTLVKVGQYIFGGYATASWEGFLLWKQAKGSFIFSLRNKENVPPFKASLKDENTQHAIYAYHRYGPIFGYGHDLYIADDAISNNPSHSSTYFNTTYQAPSVIRGNVIKILAGTFRFSPSEVEVFYLV